MYMSFLKEEIEEHLRRNYLTKENQTGFTKGGRKEENLFMMQYVMRRAIRSGKQLIVIAIDYSKAYDSLDRRRLIEQLIEYKIHPNVIDTIAKLYKGDFTRITIGEEQVKLNVTNGIRQGCTLSTTLFKIVTFKIISELEKHGRSYHIDGIDLVSLFYADDSILVGESLEDAKHNLKVLAEASKKFGLKPKHQ